MSSGFLNIDLTALTRNWQALDAMTEVETAAVVKADGYGLGVDKVARALARAGAKTFFVAVAEEGVRLRQALGPNPAICVFSGHMRGDTDMIGDMGLTPMINTVGQLTRHLESLPDHPFGIQLDTGMNRLGMEIEDWASVAEIALGQNCQLVMSHLACQDDPEHPMNRQQLEEFHLMTDGIKVPRSLAATGAIQMGPEYHFDLTWTAQRPTKLVTVSAGYADGIHRVLSNKAQLWHGSQPVSVVGRVSMDLITADVTDLDEVPGSLSLLSPQQTVDDIADQSGTIGYEVLTALGSRYARRYSGA
jgi:alanine racemase